MSELSWRLGCVCPHDCPDTCMLEVGVDGDGIARATRGYHDHPVTQGWLCAKVRDYHELYHHPERLLTPLLLRGKKGSGQFEPVSWERALAMISDRWSEIISRVGAAAILPYSYSGTLGLLQMGVCNERFWNRLGASGLERSICGAAAETAIKATLGKRWAPKLRDLEHCRLLIVWGHNPASTAPHAMPFIRAAQRAGCKVVLIDPRRTLTARGVDWHLAPRPASDGALALGLAHIMYRDQAVDQRWLDRHASGGEAFAARVAAFTPDRVAELCGLDRAEIEKLAQLMARCQPLMIKTADGVQRHDNGGQTMRAIACLPALLGQYGVRGGGLFYSASDSVSWDREAVGKASLCAPTPRVVNMNRLGAALLGEVRDPRIASLYVFGANPVASAPNAAKIVEGLSRRDLFTVVHEQFMTDTARYADIVLPATTQLEQLDLHRPYGHDVLVLNRPVMPLRGEARSNWDTLRALANSLEIDEPWLLADGREVIAEILEASARNDRALAGVTLERLERELMIELRAEDTVPFADGHFPTPSGKVELVCEALAEQLGDALPDYRQPLELSTEPDGGLILISGASHHFVSSSLFPLARLRHREGPPRLEIHPDDAADRGIEDGDTVCVKNERGAFTSHALLTEGVRPGVVIALKGRWPSACADGRNVNWTTPDRLGDLAGQSTFHSNRVWVSPQRSNRRTR